MPGPGDPFRQIVHGQDPPNHTAMWNRLLDLARVRAAGGATGDVADLTRDLDIIKVRNDSGAAVPRFGVLGLASGAGPVITPSSNLPEFQRQPALSGVVPQGADAGKFCVLLEPLAPGAIGRAAVAGVVPVLLSASGGTADVLPGDATQLQPAGSGSATVLWTVAGSGAQGWALVRLGGAGAGITVQDDSGTPVFPGVTDLEFHHADFLLQLLSAGIVLVSLRLGGTIGIVTNVCPTFATLSGVQVITALTVEVTPVTLPASYGSGSASCTVNPSGCCSGSGSGSGGGGQTCDGVSVPGTLHATFHVLSGDTSLDGQVATLTWSSDSGVAGLPGWTGSLPDSVCGQPLALALVCNINTCPAGSAGALLNLVGSSNGCAATGASWSPVDLVFSGPAGGNWSVTCNGTTTTFSVTITS